MRILVFVKQIPEVTQVKFDPATNRIVREGVPLQINSFDKKAMEEAARIKEKHGAEVIAATMGPPSASDILVTCMKFGADSGYLISDRRLGGSDTLITSMALSAFAKKFSPDLIFCGKYSLDGETSQVPAEISTFLGYDFRSSVSQLKFEGDLVTTVQDLEAGFLTSSAKLPLVISVSEKINKARFIRPGGPDFSDKINTVGLDFLGISLNGMQDSPTVVEGTESVSSRRKVKFIGDVDEFITLILNARSEDAVSEESMSLKDAPNGSREAWVIAIDNPDTVREISTKAAEITNGEARIVIIGNLDPGALKNCPAHEYQKLETNSSHAIAGYIAEGITRSAPRFVLFPSTVNGRDIASFVAARLKLGLTADCVDLKLEGDRLVQYKPAFGGGILARIHSKTKPAMATIRPGIFQARVCNYDFPVKTVELGYNRSESFERLPSEFRPVTNNGMVIGIGKGLLARENVPRVIELAAMLDASVGGTRPIIDLDWLPRQQQIGLTGVSISPAVYLAIGISGHDNHVVGFRYAGKVFSVNKDGNAPIFSYSDYGFIGDSLEFLGRFAARLEKLST
ncbi:MAG: FAD-binding protein [Candidatus Thermoplasmatota archaeon]|nr:FAD-binding protein [Candidatus Thermoplasmatota archaeon]MCL5800347.1 FAD-binding protein [Candidatus Thermoplasmatota archaeon]